MGPGRSGARRGALRTRGRCGPGRSRIRGAPARAAPHPGHGCPDAFTPPRSPLNLLHPNASRALEGPHAMTISMYKASVPVFLQFLTSLSAVLDKAAAYAVAKKIEPAVLLNTRLTPDMFPLLRQVRA